MRVSEIPNNDNDGLRLRFEPENSSDEALLEKIRSTCKWKVWHGAWGNFDNIDVVLPLREGVPIST